MIVALLEIRLATPPKLTTHTRSTDAPNLRRAVPTRRWASRGLVSLGLLLATPAFAEEDVRYTVLADCRAQERAHENSEIREIC